MYGTKKINAIVVGMGLHGIEMTKSLAWFCQMDGYTAEINTFDIRDDAEDIFCSMCPELMSPEFNNNFSDPGEAQYKISIHFQKFYSSLLRSYLLEIKVPLYQK